jgi:hypothetical protein
MPPFAVGPFLLKLVARTYWPASATPPANRTGTSGFPRIIRGPFEQQLELSMPMPIETKEVTPTNAGSLIWIALLPEIDPG